jgi:hypothetical protein
LGQAVKSSGFLIGALLTLCVTAGSAAAADRWEEAAGGAVAILPAPIQASGILGGSLYCAEQKWSFLFRTDTDAAMTTARIGLEGENFELPAVNRPASMHVSIPLGMLDLLRKGTRMRVETGEAGATFSLRNSGKVLDAIAPRCSQIDMSAYREVTLLDTGPAVETARDLFADEIKLFRAASGKEPTVMAIEIEVTDAKRLLFGALCGSTAYYGKSGCTMWGWANTGSEWRPVYETEGQRLYLDDKTAKDGWPGLATLPVINGIEPTHWIWNGSIYRFDGPDLTAGESQ